MNSPIIFRQDLLTRKSYPKDELLRLVVIEGVLTFDPEQKKGGRGIYLHKDQDTLKKAFNGKALKRYSQNKTSLDDLYQELVKYVG